jgi:sugar phosphate isomerase/epimerase
MIRILSTSRRRFLAGSAFAAISASVVTAADDVAVPAGGHRDPWHGLKVGVASYSLRKLNLDATITAIKRTGLRYVSIKDMHLPMKSTAEERKGVAKKFRDAGIEPLSCGVISIENNEDSARLAFEYAKDCGIPTIVCSPDPQSLPILDKMVKEYDIRLAIHNHGPGDKRWPSPYDVMAGVEKFDARIGCCIDVGHTARAGVNPVEAIVKCKERFFDMHLKDLAAAGPNAAPVEVGRGVLDVRGMMKALLEIKYVHLVSFEYEKDADDPRPGLGESVGYVKGVLGGI